MKSLPLIKLFVVGVACFLIPACEVENCPPNAMTYAHFTLSDQYGNTFKTSDTITVIGQTWADVTVYDKLPDGSVRPRVVSDSLISDTIVNRENAANSFSIPLSYSDKTRIVFAYRSLEHTFVGTDTLYVEHRNIPYFTNLDCGTMMFYEIVNIAATRHRLDSVAVTNPNINNNEKENFKIYFTVASTDE